MANRSALCATYLSLALMTSCGPGQRVEQPPTPEAAHPTLESLPENERPFVGRWCVDMTRLIDGEKADGHPGMDPIGFTVLRTLLLDLDTDHTAYGNCAVNCGTGTWSVSGDTATLKSTAANYNKTTLTRVGSEIRCSLGGANKPVIMIQAEQEAPIIPSSLSGQWVIDLEATATATNRGSQTMDRYARAAYGESAQIPPTPTVTPEIVKAQLSQVFNHGTPTIALADVPKTDTGVAEIRGMGDQPTAFTYTIHRDTIYLREATIKGPGELILAFRVIDGKLTWDMAYLTMVFRKK